MTVKEFIQKWNIDENSLRIYDMELEDEIWRSYEMSKYYGCKVVKAYPHNGDTVLQVSSING